jgi:hypothetical protein
MRVWNSPVRNSRWSVTMQVLDPTSPSEVSAPLDLAVSDSADSPASNSRGSGSTSAFAPSADEDFDYKPVAILGPVSLFIGVCAATGLMFPSGVLLGLAGILLAIVALYQIRVADGELTGRFLAVSGLVVSTAMTLAGGGYHGYVYATEVPEGYERLSFSWLSNQGMIVEESGARPTEDVAKFDGKKVYIKGYMYPVRQRHGLTEFVLCKDNGDCCFGGQPKLTDMIAVKMQPGLSVDLLEQQLVGVAGIFRASTVTQSGELTSVYMLEGTHFR